jgi:hypothetical protein
LLGGEGRRLGGCSGSVKQDASASDTFYSNADLRIRGDFADLYENGSQENPFCRMGLNGGALGSKKPRI